MDPGLSVYVSLFPDPFASGVDVLSLDWDWWKFLCLSSTESSFSYFEQTGPLLRISSDDSSLVAKLTLVSKFV